MGPLHCADQIYGSSRRRSAVSSPQQSTDLTAPCWEIYIRAKVPTCFEGILLGTSRDLGNSGNNGGRFCLSLQAAQKAGHRGRRRNKTGGVASGYVEDFDELRTKVEGFFSSLP